MEKQEKSKREDPELIVRPMKGVVMGKRVETGIATIEDLDKMFKGQIVVFYTRGIYAAGLVENIKTETREREAPYTKEKHTTSFLMFVLAAPQTLPPFTPSFSIDQFTGITVRLLGSQISYWLDGFDPVNRSVIVIKRTRESAKQ